MQYVLFHILGTEAFSLKLLNYCEAATQWSLKFFLNFKNSIHISKIRLGFHQKFYLLVLFTEIITLHCENFAKCTNTVGRKSGVLNVTKKAVLLVITVF